MLTEHVIGTNPDLEVSHPNTSTQEKGVSYKRYNFYRFKSIIGVGYKNANRALKITTTHTVIVKLTKMDLKKIYIQDFPN